MQALAQAWHHIQFRVTGEVVQVASYFPPSEGQEPPHVLLQACRPAGFSLYAILQQVVTCGLDSVDYALAAAPLSEGVVASLSHLLSYIRSLV